MTTSTPETRTTRIVLAFEPSKHCPLATVDGELIDAQNSLVDEACHCQYIIRASDGASPMVTHTSQEHTSDCVCHVFGDYDCVPDILAVESGSVIVSAFLSDRDVICNLIEDLRSVTERVKIREIVDGADDIDASKCEVNLAKLTEKQQRALELATDKGYYEQPSAVSLSEIADELDISKQALSQRLNAAEQTLFEQLIDR